MSHRSDKKEWTALVAAFLLFAAALLVVSPAEASRTTTDARSNLAPSSSLELPPLGPVEPIDPVESSPHFGFGENLGLLDPKAGPGGFVVFAVGTAQCELTYARNNPATFIDPTGLLAECVGDRCTDSTTVVAVDPAAESARRALLELQMMRLRSSSRSHDSSFGRQLFGAFTNNQMPTLIRGVADSDWMDPFGRHVLYEVADLLPTDLPGFGLFALSLADGGLAQRAAPATRALSKKIVRQMGTRGWTVDQILEAFSSGMRFDAPQRLNPASRATRYVHPVSGQSVVIDDLTGEVIHVGGPGFLY